MENKTLTDLTTNQHEDPTKNSQSNTHSQNERIYYNNIYSSVEFSQERSESKKRSKSY